ncbi:hypothetical protein DVA67_027920 [Solirubrobacter sp. CPCC 204708]|uniref:DUF11 domain-containing protein n=1 Tax=Solirubrobacter deserti TaxID=2282478 RepID=A0ABT4RJL9_9ACTN|nr:hypothetical protein [Solirubrobacter deserti]MBE2319824.1 hypothetical protein [Solirubrobacter deserti]MDA0138695.1 hypothetical protein [Solirubrobacter deserti]
MLIARKAATAAAVIASLGAVALPATAGAATTTTTTQNHTYHISVNPGMLAGGQNTVTARVKVTNPENSVRRFWSRSTVQQVVRQGVNNGYQKPYMSQGFRCTPTLDGSMNASTARFTCKLQGADVPTTVTLTFTAPYLPPTAG